MHADDMDLVREFAKSGSEAAFATLARRHVNLVYSAALRRLGNATEAEEVAQNVFIILAKKARSLRRGTILSGWLYQTAQFAAANYQRAAVRRQHREQAAFMQFTEQSDPLASWDQVSPLLEEAMARLSQKERDAIVLRFFENRTVREVAVALGLREAAAQKRVNRATGNLRDFFLRRGIPISTAVLLASIGTHAVQAAPVELVSKIAATAGMKIATGGGSTLTLKGALKIMAMTKVKTAIVVFVGVLVVTGLTTITVKQIQEHRTYPWEVPHWRPEIMNQVPPQVKIVPAKFPRGGMGVINGKMMGIGQPLSNIFPHAFGISWSRTICQVPLPAGNYDFIANLSQGSAETLQRAIEKKFGLVAKRETRDTEILLLTVRNPGAPSLTRANQSPSQPSQLSEDSGKFSCRAYPLSVLAGFLESYFRTPVVNGTGFTGNFNADLEWDEQHGKPDSLPALKQALIDQLGLDLVPTNMPIEMLIVEKAH